ncbi:hypothetical protein PINS_up024237 [Pythium insidiosum]|nr:hypothetical protein PINS_up024237 [Pythium insidiosum]
MREFEARMNLHSLLANPLDTTLGRLTLDEKERVMLKMQRTIRGITADVDALFLRLQREMDALGIFDAAANQLRAQTLCLVELEKRCRLDKIRDDAVREVLIENREGVLPDTGEKDPTRRMSSSRALLQMEGKLKNALSKRKEDSDGQQKQKHQGQKQQRAPLHCPRHEPITRPSALDAARKRRAKGGAKVQSAQAITGASTATTTAAASAATTAAAPVSNQSEVADIDNADAEASSVLARHPHIAHAIQLLANRSGMTASSSAMAVTTAQSNTDTGDDPLHTSTGTLNLADEWSERSPCYRTIAARSVHELQARHARWRWDSTAHFTLMPTSLSVATAALERIRTFHLPPDSGSREDESDAAMVSTRESNADKQRRVAADYEQLQQRIRSRLEQLEELHATHALPAITSRRVPHSADDDEPQ